MFDRLLSLRTAPGGVAQQWDQAGTDADFRVDLASLGIGAGVLMCCTAPDAFITLADGHFAAPLQAHDRRCIGCAIPSLASRAPRLSGR
jgi:hypothetical protein